VLGSVVNWLMGWHRALSRQALVFGKRRWTGAGSALVRNGKSLLFSWVPILGDPLTVVAGVMKEPLTQFVLLVAIAKMTRYLAVAAITLNWT
jgi:membrane protein YqaA with SNARE-associated domain